MAVIAMPGFGIRSVDWVLDQPAQVNRSEFTAKRRVMPLGRGFWAASVGLRPLYAHEVGKWRGFLAALRGQVNVFDLPAVEAAQISGVVVRVNGAGQGGYALQTTGWGAGAGKRLETGQFIAVGSQLLQLTEPVVANAAGSALVRFVPALRTRPADGTLIEVAWPKARMALSDSRIGWNVEPGPLYSAGFSCEEAF